MNRFKRGQVFLVVLCLCLTLAPVTDSSTLTVQTAIQSNETFKFTKVDLDLLEQVNLLDKQFDKEGLVYNDESVNAYLSRVGGSVLPAGARLENVEWRFRILRDPMPNAFALLNGSIYINAGLLSLLDSEA